jgi:hypothetical protein
VPALNRKQLGDAKGVSRRLLSFGLLSLHVITL